MTFSDWLTEEGYAPSTRERYRRYAEAFQQQMADGPPAAEPEEIRYADILAWLRRLEGSPSSRYKRLRAVTLWLSYLQAEGRREDNPAASLSIKGLTTSLPADVLTAEELDQIYREQPSTPAARADGLPVAARSAFVAPREKAMLGLIVYQALDGGELALLTPEMLGLEAGHVRVPSNGRTRPRTLRLEANQVLPLITYLKEIRPQIIERYEAIHPQSPGPGRCDSLFLTSGPKGEIKYTLVELTRRLRKRHAFFRGLRQLQASRITCWTQRYGLRRAQHMAGHRTVAATERYRQASQADLKRALERYHPLQ